MKIGGAYNHPDDWFKQEPTRQFLTEEIIKESLELGIWLRSFLLLLLELEVKHHFVGIPWSTSQGLSINKEHGISIFYQPGKNIEELILLCRIPWDAFWRESRPYPNVYADIELVKRKILKAWSDKAIETDEAGDDKASHIAAEMVKHLVELFVEPDEQEEKQLGLFNKPSRMD